MLFIYFVFSYTLHVEERTILSILCGASVSNCKIFNPNFAKRVFIKVYSPPLSPACTHPSQIFLFLTSKFFFQFHWNNIDFNSPSFQNTHGHLDILNVSVHLYICRYLLSQHTFSTPWNTRDNGQISLKCCMFTCSYFKIISIDFYIFQQWRFDFVSSISLKHQKFKFPSPKPPPPPPPCP